MSSHAVVLALGLSLAALGVAGYVLLQERSEPYDVAVRLDEMHERVQRLERAVAERSAPSTDEPALRGTERPDPETPDPLTVEATPPEETADAGEGLLGLGAGSRDETAREIEALVEKAVEKKAAQMRHMRNKKPGIEDFAETLELTDLQRKAAADEVLRAQQEIFGLLENVPAEDGTNFMEVVVETVAQGLAKPGAQKERFGKLFQRLMSERIPGSDETYMARIEAAKQRVRDSFKRNWTPAQFARFEAWQMDPTEIRGIEGSPRPALERRVRERARQLGAKIPDEKDG